MNKWMANKSFLKIFFTLLLIVLIMFISNYSVYKNSIDGIYQQMKKNNNLVVQSIIQSFDGVFRDLNNLIYSVHNVPYNGDIVNGKLDMFQVFGMREAIAKAFAASTTRDYVEEIIVFYDNTDLAITSTGTSKITDLFGMKYNNGLYNSLFWETLFDEPHNFTVFPVDDYTNFLNTGFNNRKNLIAVASSNPYSEKNIILLIDYNKLLNYVGLNTLMQDADMIILDEHDNMILSTEARWSIVDVMNEVSLNAGDETTIERSNFEYTMYKSDYNGYVYINKTPLSFTNVDSVTKANRVIMYWTIVVALLLSAVLSIYLFRPLQDLVKLLGGSGARKNNFKEIQSGIEKIQEQNKTFRSKMDIMQSELQRGMFLNAVEKLPHSKEVGNQIKEHFAEFFKNRMFMIASLYIENSSMCNEEAALGLTVEKMTTQLQESFKELENIMVFHAGGRHFIVLIGIQKPEERRQAIKLLEKILSRPAAIDLPDCRLWGAVSRVRESSIEQLGQAYHDIQEVWQYRSANDKGPLFDISTMKQKQLYDFSLPPLDKLSNCLLSGNEQEAVRIIETIIEDNLQTPSYQFEILLKVLFSYLSKYFNKSKEGQAEIQSKEREFYKQVEQAFEYEKPIGKLIELAQQVAQQQLALSKNYLDAGDIVKYIELHYMDNLYLDHMAEVFNTTPKYFSNYFKKTFDVNFVEYLNRVRLKRAQDLLRNKELSVAAIGEKVGYMNSSTFTTTFKKYFGISPSQFRKQNM